MPAEPKGGLVEIAQEAGIDFVHEPGVDSTYFMPEMMGPGSALFDYDNDGKLDIYLVNGRVHNGSQSPEAYAKNRLYRQEANGRFRDVTEESGLGDTGYGMGAAAGDIDNDGDVDVYVSNFDADALYRNNGDGTFTNITQVSGIHNERWGCSVAFLDYDLDGFLDIYVTNYVVFDPNIKCTLRNGRPEYCSPFSYKGDQDMLFHNNGDGTFTDVSEKSGIGNARLKGLGVIATDVNADGYPDIYVANDKEENLFWVNQKDGTFLNEALMLGAALNHNGESEAGMGLALGDVNGDLLADIYITHVENESNTLYLNRGSGGFRDNSRHAGFEKNTLLPYTGFGVGFADLDLDGRLDLVIGNGRIRRTEAPSVPGETFWEPYGETNLIFSGQADGKFKNVSADHSAFCDAKEVSRGVAFGDIDNDGDVDILVNNSGGPARLYRNDLSKKGNWLSITAYDPALKRIAVGATVTVKAENFQASYPVNPYYSYLCSHDARVHIGLGAQKSIAQIIVEWPGGSKEAFAGGAANRHILLEKGNGKAL